MSWEDKPEPQVVVRVARPVPVPISRPHVPLVVVPATAAFHTVGASGNGPFLLCYP